MPIINEIRKKILNKEYEFTVPHFFEEMANDNIDFEDIELVIKTGKVGQKYTNDMRGIRYEIIGTTKDGRIISIICRIKETGKLLLITTFILE